MPCLIPLCRQRDDGWMRTRQPLAPIEHGCQAKVMRPFSFTAFPPSDSDSVPTPLPSIAAAHIPGIGPTGISCGAAARHTIYTCCVVPTRGAPCHQPPQTPLDRREAEPRSRSARRPPSEAAAAGGAGPALAGLRDAGPPRRGLGACSPEAALGEVAPALRCPHRVPRCVGEVESTLIVAIFYPFSQFCEINISLPSL